MSDSVENHTLRLLQEMRAETNGRFDALAQRFDEVTQRFDDVTHRIDGNTLLLNLVAGGLHDHEQRISHLESKTS